LKKFVSARLSKEKSPIKKELAGNMLVLRNFSEIVYKTDIPVPWFGVSMDDDNEIITEHDVDSFLTFRIEPGVLHMEMYDLLGHHSFEEWKKWEKVFAIQFDKSNIYYLQSVADELDDYVETFPKSGSNRIWKNIRIQETDTPNKGKLYFSHEGDCILFKYLQNENELVVETFDTSDKLTSFTAALRFAVEQTEKEE